MSFEVVDVAFRVTGQGALATTHTYPLYGALARRWPWLHEAEDLGVFSLRGNYTSGQLQLQHGATLRLRAPAEMLPQVISLTGKHLEVGDANIQIGVPQVLPLRPASSLYAKLVQIKLADCADGVTPELFLESANKQLVALGIDAEASIPLWQRGPRTGEPQRRVVHIKGERHVGFALLVQGLTADESLRLQQRGLGGRRKMGCGLFLPVRGAR